MKTLLRLVYVSRSTETNPEALSLEVGRILRKSRENNARVGVGGVLYFGNGYFFQCLEGEQSAVEATFKRIAADQRHEKVAVLLREPVKTLQFKRWSMKFVPTEQSIQQFLSDAGLKSFAPYAFNETQVRRLLLHLQNPKSSRPAAENRSWWQKIPGFGGRFAKSSGY